MKVFFIEGNIGSGKSTLLTKIENYLYKHNIKNVKCIQEPIDLWKGMKDSLGKNILEHFYADPKKNCYMFQSFAFISRLKHLDEIKDGYIYIMERSILTDKFVFATNCYENKLMTEIEWLTYNMWFDAMYLRYCKLFKNAKFFYIKCSPETSFYRIQQRNRPEEMNIELDYIKQIHEKHEDWLTGKENTIFIDGEKNILEQENFNSFMLSFMTHIFPRSTD